MKKLLLLSALSLFVFASCSTEEVEQEQQLQFSPETLEVLAQLEQFASAGKGSVTRMQPPIYGGDECTVYSGIVTPAQFKPESDPFDELYALAGRGTFADGIPLISDARPGDQHYNGGRWHMNVLKADVEASKYESVCSVEDLDLEDFESAGAYFACPMRPRNN